MSFSKPCLLELRQLRFAGCAVLEDNPFAIPENHYDIFSGRGGGLGSGRRLVQRGNLLPSGFSAAVFYPHGKRIPAEFTDLYD